MARLGQGRGGGSSQGPEAVRWETRWAWAAGGSCFPLGRAGAGQLLGGEQSSAFPQSGAVTLGAHTFHSRRRARPGLESRQSRAAARRFRLQPAAPPSPGRPAAGGRRPDPPRGH